MRKLAGIVAIAGAVRLATGISAVLAAAIIGGVAVAAAAYGLWTHRRLQLRSWTESWGVLSLGLVAVVVGAAMEGVGHAPLLTPDAVPLTLTLVGDGLAIVGLCLLIHWRMPGRAAEALTTAVVSTLALWFTLLTLVVVPGHGWHPGTQLPSMAVPALEFIMVALTGSLMSMSEKHPVAYRYLLVGFACLFVCHAVSSALFLAGRTSSPVPLDAVALWGACLWGGSVLHPSQRVAFEPVPLRTGRPTWPHVVLLLAATMVVPGTLLLQSALGLPPTREISLLGSALLPALVVGYLLHQVFARSAAEYRAQHDALTGVCNRVLFSDSLAASLLEAGRNDSGLALMFLDLDRFKSINDSLGHSVGNQLLQAVVKRLQSCLRPRDTLARMGGDEFTILFPDIDSKEQAANLAERILGAFAEPFNVGGRLLPVQASIGVAVHPDDGDEADELFRHADTAMYQAKAAGRNTYVVYDTAMSARARLRFALESSLRSALEQGRLTVHFQPKLRVSDGAMVGVEALARWSHPRLGMIPPWAFIPLAEETSLIASLGEWVLEISCVEAKRWHERTGQRISVAVNLSPRQFVRQSVVTMVADVLERTQFDPTLLELEVTEGVLMEHMDEAAASLSELRAMGIRCSIDDFGTGYSALTYLTDIPVDAIKIDPSFVRRIDSESGAAPIVGAVISLAHSLGLQVVAEGVETDAQLQFLQAAGADYVQGYLFKPAVTSDEIEELLLANWPEVVAAPEDVDEPLRLRPQVYVLPSARLSTILTGMASDTGWSEEPDVADLEAVLAALQTGEDVPAAARQLAITPARMALGTLAGLASITGGLSAAGALPKVTQDFAATVLHQATGLGVAPLDAGSDTGSSPGAPTLAAADMPVPSHSSEPGLGHGGAVAAESPPTESPPAEGPPAGTSGGSTGGSTPTSGAPGSGGPTTVPAVGGPSGGTGGSSGGGPSSGGGSSGGGSSGGGSSGNSGNAPGHGGANPGNGNSNGNSGGCGPAPGPGSSGSSPGHNDAGSCPPGGTGTPGTKSPAPTPPGHGK